jgi:hypothetical protein
MNRVVRCQVSDGFMHLTARFYKLVPDSFTNELMLSQGIKIPERSHATMPPQSSCNTDPISKHLANSLPSKVAFCHPCQSD